MSDEGETIVFRLLDAAERKIQAIMLELAEDIEGSGWRIEALSVDTRNFANMKPEILVSQVPSAKPAYRTEP